MLNTGGTPGNKGGGRRPNEFKAWMQVFPSGKDVVRGIKEVLETGPSHPLWLGVVKHCTERGYGKPNEEKGATANNGALAITANQ